MDIQTVNMDDMDIQEIVIPLRRSIIVSASAFFVLVLNFLIIESLIRWTTSKIRYSALKSIFYWSMFCVSRFVFCDLGLSLYDRRKSLVLNDFRPDESVWLIIGHLAFVIAGPPLTGLTMWLLFQVLPFGLWFLVNKIKQLMSDRKTIYLAESWTWWARHMHPSYDCVNYWYDSSFRSKCIFATVLDNNRQYDPSWPRCSVVHSVMIFMCNHCSKDNGLHILRKSIYGRQIRTLWFHPLPRIAFDDADQIMAFESNGAIVISLPDRELMIIDLRSGSMTSVDLVPFLPNPLFLFCFAMCDDGSELGDRRNSSSIYLRLFSRRLFLLGGRYRQSLIEVPLITGYGDPVELSREEYIWPAPLKVLEANIFPMSRDRVGILVKIRRHPFNGVKMHSVIWDPNRRKLIGEDYKDLIKSETPLRIVTERYHKSSIVLLNDMEAIVRKSDWSIWRTSFRPPSLKNLSLERIFRSLEGS